MSTEKNNPDIRWIIGGAVSLIIAGMAVVTVLSLASDKDQTATIASIGTMITMGVAGIFGLYKINEGVQKKIDENTQLTERVAVGQHQVIRRLNGELDQRVAEASRQAVVDAMPSIKRAIVEALEDFSSTTTS